MILPGWFQWVVKSSVPRLLGSRSRGLMLSPSVFWLLSLSLVKVLVLRQPPACSTALTSIPIMRRMNGKGETHTEHHNIQNSLVWAHLSPLVPENTSIEGKTDFNLSWLLYAHSSTWPWTAETWRSLQHGHSSSHDLQCPFAGFWHLKQFITSRDALPLAFPYFFLQKYSWSFSSTLPASVRNTTHPRLVFMLSKPTFTVTTLAAKRGASVISLITFHQKCKGIQ